MAFPVLFFQSSKVQEKERPNKQSQQTFSTKIKMFLLHHATELNDFVRSIKKKYKINIFKNVAVSQKASDRMRNLVPKEKFFH